MAKLAKYDVGDRVSTLAVADSRYEGVVRGLHERKAGGEQIYSVYFPNGAKTEVLLRESSLFPYVGSNTSEPDVVNNPSHYGGADNPYEVIKVLEAWGLHEDAYLFNVIKYLARAGKKDKDKDLQDHQKALYYLKRKIANMEKESK